MMATATERTSEQLNVLSEAVNALIRDTGASPDNSVNVCDEGIHVV